MKSEDIASYFERKIAKPIPFDVVLNYYGSPYRNYYVIEPTAVRDGVLHCMISFKYRSTEYKPKQGEAWSGAEAEVPICDDDTIQYILMMALSAALNIRNLDGPDSHALTEARKDVDDRLNIKQIPRR
jgi:hypothetical protein